MTLATPWNIRKDKTLVVAAQKIEFDFFTFQNLTAGRWETCHSGQGRWDFGDARSHLATWQKNKKKKHLVRVRTRSKFFKLWAILGILLRAQAWVAWLQILIWALRALGIFQALIEPGMVETFFSSHVKPNKKLAAIAKIWGPVKSGIGLFYSELFFRSIPSSWVGYPSKLHIYSFSWTRY